MRVFEICNSLGLVVEASYPFGKMTLWGEVPESFPSPTSYEISSPEGFGCFSPLIAVTPAGKITISPFFREEDYELLRKLIEALDPEGARRANEVHQRAQELREEIAKREEELEFLEAIQDSFILRPRRRQQKREFSSPPKVEEVKEGILKF